MWQILNNHYPLIFRASPKCWRRWHHHHASLEMQEPATCPRQTVVSDKVRIRTQTSAAQRHLWLQKRLSTTVYYFWWKQLEKRQKHSSQPLWAVHKPSNSEGHGTPPVSSQEEEIKALGICVGVWGGEYGTVRTSELGKTQRRVRSFVERPFPPGVISAQGGPCQYTSLGFRSHTDLRGEVPGG